MIEPELWALDFMKIALFYLVSINQKYKNISILMKLYHIVYGHKISNEFDYWRYWTSMSWVICPWISKNAINHFVYTRWSSFLHQFWLYLYRMFITIRSWMSLILNDKTWVTGPWYFENCIILRCLYSSICKFKVVFMKHCDNVCGR